jgi:hypothetical protein
VKTLSELSQKLENFEGFGGVFLEKGGF